MTVVSQVLFLLSLFAASIQSSPNPQVQSLNRNELQRLIEHLKTHAFSKPKENRARHEKSKHQHHPLLNVQTLNMYLKSRDESKNQQIENQDKDRACKAGRCGGGDREDTVNDQEGEVQQVLDELEKELSRSTVKCPGGYPCGRGCCGEVYRAAAEDEESENDDDSNYTLLQLRCGCGRRPSRFANRDAKEEYEREQLCCGCGRRPSRSGDLESRLKKLGKKYKLNDDLDAIVVDISNIDASLENLVENLNDVQVKNRKPNIEANLDYVLGKARNENANEAESNELDAYVINLAPGEEEKDVVDRVVNELLLKTNQKRNDDPVRPNDLADFYLSKKQKLVENALNFVKNSRGDKDISHFSDNQKYQLQKLRSHIQKVGAAYNDNETEKLVLNIVLGKGTKSQVLPHNENNNNVFVPKWVYEAVKRSRDDLRSKQLFPLTLKQKHKMSRKNKHLWRRNAQKQLNEYGVPFELQIQALGQVEP